MGEKTFSTKDANIYEDRTVIECPECAFEFSVIHDLSDKAGEYTCPNCEELRLIDENKRLREALENVQEQLFTIRGKNELHDGEITGLCIQIRQALEGM